MYAILRPLWMSFIVCIGGAVAFSQAHATSTHRAEILQTDAGHIDFASLQTSKLSTAVHKIESLDREERALELEDGSRWSVSKIDALQGWDKSKNLVVTQNHATFSTARYALVNVDLKLATPISLVREPTPGKESLFVKSVDRVNDVVTLSNHKVCAVHSADRGALGKISENDRIILGVNTGDSKDKSPYLLIDTSSHHFLRAQVIE